MRAYEKSYHFLSSALEGRGGDDILHAAQDKLPGKQIAFRGEISAAHLSKYYSGNRGGGAQQEQGSANVPWPEVFIEIIRRVGPVLAGVNIDMSSSTRRARRACVEELLRSAAHRAVGQRPSSCREK